MLALEVEYLTGTTFAASSTDRDRADWPPQPDRAFSALVAAWGARGETPEEADALRWLERADPPSIIASDAFDRDVVQIFVPPNDVTAPGPGKKAAGAATSAPKGALAILPENRPRQPRTIPAVRPHDRMVRFLWTDEPDAVTLEALDALARDVTYLGHSSSLVRCRFSIDGDCEAGVPATRRVYPGRLDELVRAFRAGVRPNPGAYVRTRAEPLAAAASGLLGERWLVLEDVGGTAPDLVATAVAARLVRRACMSGFNARGLAVPLEVSGHDSDGGVTRETHVSVVPLADVGWTHATGRVLGMAIVLPRRAEADGELEREIEATLAALAVGDDMIVLQLTRQLRWHVERSSHPSRKSLQVERYLGSRELRGERVARRWATVTPIALDTFPKGDGDARDEAIAASIARSCERVGLPRPAGVRVGLASDLAGVPAAHASGGPPWRSWQLPESLRGRYLTHAVLEFDRDMHGPVIVGAGRFLGLGLCLALPGGDR